MIQFLHDKGGDLDNVDRRGRTPLMEATLWGWLKVVKSEKDSSAWCGGFPWAETYFPGKWFVTEETIDDDKNYFEALWVMEERRERSGGGSVCTAIIRRPPRDRNAPFGPTPSPWPRPVRNPARNPRQRHPAVPSCHAFLITPPKATFCFIIAPQQRAS